MASPTPNATKFPQDSIVLVTGANGLIASWVADQLLATGYRVRGTVRNLSRCSWLTPFFTDRYGAGRFELIEVPDLAAPGAWGVAIKGVSGVAAVAAGMSMSDRDLDSAVDLEFLYAVNLLQAAKDEPGVKSFIFTSSAWAAWTPDPAKKTTLHEWSYNDDVVRLVRNTEEGQTPPGWTDVMAMKTLVEKRVWDWVRAEKPAYAFNTILPDTVIGATLSPQDQGIQSTCGMVRWVRQGVNLNIVADVRPQWFVDTRDLGLLYVAALATPGVDGERLFGFAERFSFKQVAELLRELDPDHEMGAMQDDGWDQTEVPNQRAESLVRELKGNGQGWAKFKDSVADCLGSIKKLDG